MVLDDEPIVGRRLKPALEKLGVEVEVFEDPGLAVVRLGETEFDVVVTDLRMRGLDGFAVLERVRASSSRTRVVLITAHATGDTVRDALARGAFDVIGKPFKTQDIREVIERAARVLEMPLAGSAVE